MPAHCSADVLPAPHDAGGVHKPVKLPEAPDRLGDTLVSGAVIAEVSGISLDGLRGARDLSEPLLVASGGQHAGTFAGATPRDRLADPGGGTGD